MGPEPGEDLVTVEQTELPKEELASAIATGASIVIMPHARTEDGRGIYGESTVFMVKELRAAGVDARYLDESERRVFEVKKSAVAAALVPFVLGIASTAAWDLLKPCILGWFGDRKMEITYTNISADGARTSWNIRGEGKDVVEAIDKINRQTPGIEP